jgi:2-hydroxy-6-oxonona-2,4-dienedioate hydrolase
MDGIESRITGGTLSPPVERLPRARGMDRNQDPNLGPRLGHPRVTRSWKVRRIVWATVRVVGAVLLAVFVIVFLLFWQDMSAARERLSGITTDVLASQYGDIEYRLVGEGPTVLVSHGITGGLDSGESLVTQWRHIPDDYRFLYVSRFGYLNSSLPTDATPRLQAAAYRDLLDHLGIERTIVVGNSAGGASAMWFAIDFPERTSGVILLSSAVPGHVPDPIPQLVREHDFVYWAAVKFAPDMLIGMLLPESISATLTDEERGFIMDTAFKSSLPISERTEGIRFDNEVSVPGINDVPFERIEAPTLILQSVDDPREEEGGREMATRIPNSQYLGLTGGHFLLRHEEEIRAATAAFIAEVDNSSR